TRGKKAIVAVIDTGVAFEKDQKCYRARDFDKTGFASPYDFIFKDKHPTDDHGHGTHVAGTIAESTDNGEGVTGIAFEATIRPLTPTVSRSLRSDRPASLLRIRAGDRRSRSARLGATKQRVKTRESCRTPTCARSAVNLRNRRRTGRLESSPISPIKLTRTK